MRFLYDNLVDTSTLTASSQAGNLPVANVAHEDCKKVWRTGSTLTTEYIVGDMGSAKAVTAVVVHNHNLVSGDANIKFQMHTADSWGTPDFSTNLTRADKTFGAVFSSTTKRYWRLVFDKQAAGVTRDIGRLFVGTYLDTSRDADYGSIDWTKLDESVIDEAMGGSEYAEIKPQRNILKIPFTGLPEADMGGLRTMFTAVGTHKNIFAQIHTSAPYDPFYYCKLVKELKAREKAFGSDFFWDVNIDLREQVV